MPEHATKHIFTHRDHTFTITAYDVRSDPVTIRFRVDKVRTDNPASGPQFEIVREIPDWPFTIASVESDAAIDRHFMMIKREIESSDGLLPSEQGG